jgi:two-component system, chemotaxis family, chemotaxis protein CheY
MRPTAAASRNRRILIVEDDQDDMLLLDRALRSAGKEMGVTVEISHSGNGFDALSVVALGDLTSKLPDVAVIDLNMPVMRGELFLRRLRGEFGLKNVPTIVLTTSDETSIHAAALSSGADYVFVKPNSYSELLVIAGKVMEVACQGERTLVRQSA